MSEIFISYSRKDQHVADRLDAIFGMLNLSVWWDSDILPGQDWNKTITLKLNSSKCVVVIWSLSSVLSEWVLWEALEGKRRGVLIALKIDICAIPEPFATVPTFDFSGRVQEITLNDRQTQDFLKTIEAITEVDFWTKFCQNDRGTV